MRRTLFLFVAALLVLAGCATGTPGAAPVAATTVNPTSAPSAPVTAATASLASQPTATAVPTAAAATSPSATAASGSELKKLTLAMGYIPSVQFAPFYVAQERGYFKDAGLDVTFRYGMETDLMKLIASNQLQLMLGSGEEVILGRSQGLPVRYVFRWYRRFPVVLFAKESKGIHAPADLAGKRMGISALAGASYVGWKALTTATGLDPTKVNVQVVGFTQAAAVSQDRVDAALDYIVSGPTQLALAGEKLTVIPISDYMDLPSNGLITNDQVIRDNPELVQAMVNVMRHGLQDTLADPDAAFAACLRAVPEAGGQQESINRAIFDASVKLWQVDPAQMGLSDPALWQRAAEFMKQSGLVDKLVPTEDLYTNQFVSKP